MIDIKNFNYYEYINNYCDIENMNNKEAYEHYINYGINENRKYDTHFLDDFNYNFYINEYKDLKNLKYEEAILHYIRNGKYENRYFIDLSNFNYDIYLYNYDDIRNMDIEEAKYHYFKYGRLENRTYLKKIDNFMLLKNKIIIISSKCTLFISTIIKEFLNNNNCECIIMDIDKFNNLDKYILLPNEYYLIYCIFLIKNIDLLPKNKYIIYQLEQNVNDNISLHYTSLYKNNKLISILENSRLNLDYSYININLFKRKFNLNFLYLPIPVKNNIYNNKNKIYDIVFIGALNNRRRNIIKMIEKKYNIYVPEKNIYNDELHEILYKSKILINIHYYDNPILELVRINEGLYCGTRIISEKPSENDRYIYNQYKNYIDFIDIIDKDYCELYNKIKYILDNYYNDIDNYHINIRKFINTMNNNFIDKFNNILRITELFIKEKDIAVITINHNINISIIDNYKYFDWFCFSNKQINIDDRWEYIYSDDIFMINRIDFLNHYKYIIYIYKLISITNKNFIIDILNLLQKNYNQNFFIYETDFFIYKTDFFYKNLIEINLDNDNLEKVLLENKLI